MLRADHSVFIRPTHGKPACANRQVSCCSSCRCCKPPVCILRPTAARPMACYNGGGQLFSQAAVMLQQLQGSQAYIPPPTVTRLLHYKPPTVFLCLLQHDQRLAPVAGQLSIQIAAAVLHRKPRMIQVCCSKICHVHCDETAVQPDCHHAASAAEQLGLNIHNIQHAVGAAYRPLTLYACCNTSSSLLQWQASCAAKLPP